MEDAVWCIRGVRLHSAVSHIYFSVLNSVLNKATRVPADYSLETAGPRSTVQPVGACRGASKTLPTYRTRTVQIICCFNFNFQPLKCAQMLHSWESHGNRDYTRSAPTRNVPRKFRQACCTACIDRPAFMSAGRQACIKSCRCTVAPTHGIVGALAACLASAGL